MNGSMTSNAGDRRVVIDVSPSEARAWAAAGQARIVDVREPFERAAERIPDSEPAPSTGAAAPETEADPDDRRLVFVCRTGRRSYDAAARCAESRGEPAWHLAGGIEAWKAAGLPVERSARAPRLDVMRQVQIAAGALVLLGTLLGLFVHVGFRGIPIFVGTGLAFAGVSGWCGMARLLAVMPWNRTARPG